jgi:hypothetical protein
MLGVTHSAVAAAGYVLWQGSPTGALFAAVAATLSDLDRFVPGIHRGPTHFIPALLALYLFGKSFFPAIFLPILIGRAKQQKKKIDIYEALIEEGFDISYPLNNLRCKFCFFTATAVIGGLFHYALNQFPVRNIPGVKQCGFLAFIFFDVLPYGFTTNACLPMNCPLRFSVMMML